MFEHRLEFPAGNLQCLVPRSFIRYCCPKYQTLPPWISTSYRPRRVDRVGQLCSCPPPIFGEPIFIGLKDIEEFYHSVLRKFHPLLSMNNQCYMLRRISNIIENNTFITTIAIINSEPNKRQSPVNKHSAKDSRHPNCILKSQAQKIPTDDILVWVSPCFT